MQNVGTLTRLLEQRTPFQHAKSGFLRQGSRFYVKAPHEVLTWPVKVKGKDGSLRHKRKEKKSSDAEGKRASIRKRKNPLTRKAKGTWHPENC